MYLSFYNWLISLNVITSDSIYVVVNGKISSPMAEKYSAVNLQTWPCYPFLGCFHFLVIAKSTGMNVFKFMFSYFGGWISKRGLIGFCDSPMLIFWGISILFSVVPAPIYICTYSIQGVTFSSYHSLQVLLGFVFDFLLIDTLTTVRWYIIVTLIFFSLMTSNKEHLFICLWAMYTSHVEMLYNYPIHF